jgi:hypothetical protein
LLGSHQRSKGLKGLHVVSAWSCANNISLGHLSVLECFDLKDRDFRLCTVNDEIECEHERIEERKIEFLDARILDGLLDLAHWTSLNSIA